ncbi:MAG: divalent-cation tolerance protein CutA [Candidatus Heimdallarchaeota archaeon]|nr:divalent-cation tolerance protein CutA [Candidatus Heimdallarchaeota archaeon]MDH5646176.1 divalent-cation tolerance protein CutA [Candidatus Heimdallarchaeota archaeon]
MKYEIGIINTTINTLEGTELMSSTLLEQKLCACIQIDKIESKFIWSDKIQTDQEYRLQIKLLPKNIDKVTKMISTIHTYEIPEIIVTKALVNESYFDWMISVCV